MSIKTMTPAMRKALRVAARRERGNVCPVVGVHSNAETMLIEALYRRGWIDCTRIPYITAAGRAAIEATP